LGTITTTESIKQTIKLVPRSEKYNEIVKDLQVIQGKTLIFAETKRDTNSLSRYLFSRGLRASGIHGDRSQIEREAALRAFKSGKIQVLVATDVAARGLDIEDVAHVINFDLPKTIDSYVHRIGRTGRAGNLGNASAYYNNEENRGIARDLVALLKETNQQIPSFLFNVQFEPRGKSGGGAMRKGFGGSNRSAYPSRSGNGSGGGGGGGGGGGSSSGGRSWGSSSTSTSTSNSGSMRGSSSYGSSSSSSLSSGSGGNSAGGGRMGSQFGSTYGGSSYQSHTPQPTYTDHGSSFSTFTQNKTGIVNQGLRIL